ncbi:MAG: lactate utilization protein C [Cyclobacteriaceae bacterium]
MGKAEILKAVKANKPAELPIPLLDIRAGDGQDLLSLYKDRLEKGGGEVRLAKDRTEALEIVKERIGDYQYVAGIFEEINTLHLAQITDPHELELMDLAVFEGQLGVAENGAIWVNEEDLVHRVAPFITQHLVLLIREDKLVPDMHHAYKALKEQDYGHGVFIAGPSKTADIEQSLVIGAHGPKSLLVIVLRK